MSAPATINLKRRYGKLKPISREPNGPRWICRCRCGGERKVIARDLRNGTVTCCSQCEPRTAPPLLRPASDALVAQARIEFRTRLRNCRRLGVTDFPTFAQILEELRRTPQGALAEEPVERSAASGSEPARRYRQYEAPRSLQEEA